MPDRQILVAVDVVAEGVVELTLRNETKRNALSSELLAQLASEIRRAERSDFRVLMLTGAGEHFSAGANLAEVRGTTEDAAWFDLMGQAVEALRRTHLVTIACIQGACVGAALELVASCDVRMARSDASFAIPALDMGLVYAPELVRRLVTIIGPTWTTRLFLKGQRLTGSEGYDVGFVTLVAEDDPLLEARALAIDLVDRAPQATTDTVHLIRSLSGSLIATDPWRAHHERSWGSPERLDAVLRAQRRLKQRD